MMSRESVSDECGLPAWSAECYSALADALVTEDAERCRRLLDAAREADAAFADWIAAPGATGPIADGGDLARRLGEFRHRRGDDPAALRFLDALALRCELTELRTRFRQALDEAKLTALAEFAAGAGHEMNNPLAVISGRAQLLLRGESDVARRSDLALIKTQATRVHEMIADLMLFARPPAPVKEPTDLRELVRGATDQLRDAAATKDVRLIVHAPDAPVACDVDRSQFTVVVRALVENAINAVAKGGRVAVEVDRSGAHTALRVRDDGPGIPPAERELIFDPYYSGRQAGRGLGMGLPKCWRIIQQHGGQLSVAESPDGGAEFVVTLGAD